MFRLFSSSPACLMCRSLPKAFASWRRSSGKLWRATFTTGPLTDVWARHADGCTHINTHAYIRTLHQMWRARLQEENLPWHHPEECRCRAGTGSESQEAWWGRVCHASDRLWESRAKDCELHLALELSRAHSLLTCCLHERASLPLPLQSH